MAQDAQNSQEEERRLLAISLACIAQEHAASDQLLHPPCGMLHPAFMRLADAYQSLRIECKEKWLAVRTYRKKMRDDRRDDKTNNAAVLQAHALSKDLTLNEEHRKREVR
jgi:hypothetical protein